jgi:hypothetical protein
MRILAEDRRPDLVVLSARWNIEDGDKGGTGKTVGERAIDLAAELRSLGLDVVVIGPPVQFSTPLPEAMLKAGIYEEFDTSPILNMTAHETDGLMALAAEAAEVPYISVIAATCTDGRCPAMSSGAPVSWDLHHLTIEGSRALADAIAPQLITRVLP